MSAPTIEPPADAGTIRVVVIDDHPVVRNGITAAICDEDALFVAGEAESAENGLLQIVAGEPQVVVLDVRLGEGMNGIAACQLIRDQHPDVGIVVLTSHAEDIDAAVNAGAHGIVMKHSDMRYLLQAIRVAARGDEFRDPALDTVSVSDRPELTSAERRVLAPLANGASNEAIAERLCLSIHTVKSHVRSICDKLGASNRTEAAVIAHRLGLVAAETAWDRSVIA